MSRHANLLRGVFQILLVWYWAIYDKPGETQILFDQGGSNVHHQLPKKNTDELKKDASEFRIKINMLVYKKGL